MLVGILTAAIVAVIGTNGFLWWWVQSRTVPKVEQIKINQSEMNDLAQQRLNEMNYLRAALTECRDDLEEERKQG
jgi:hypothetical protein